MRRLRATRPGNRGADRPVRWSVSLALACAVALGCKEKATEPSPQPKVSLVVIEPLEGASFPQVYATWPKVAIRLTAAANDGKGGAITDGFTWTVNGAGVGTGATVSVDLAPGTHSACVSVRDQQACRGFSVRQTPPIAGTVYLAQSDSSAMPGAGLRAFVQKGADADSADVAPGGDYAISSKLALADSVILSVKCITTSCGIIPSIGVTRQASLAQKQNVVVLKRDWLLRSGRWAGITVALSTEKGYAPSAEPSLKYFLRGQTSSGWYYQVHTWPKSALPIPVAFDRTGSNLTVTAEDSIFFWKAANELNAELGVQFFKPANERDLQIDRSFGGTPIYQKGIGVWFSNTLDHAYGGYSGDNTRNIIGGVVMFHLTFGSPLMSQNQHRFVVKHELIHALGFGHNPHEAWVPGLMADYQYASDPLFGVAVKEDVAYQQAFYQVSELQKLWNAYGMPQIHQGERVVLNGLPLEPLTPVSSNIPVPNAIIVERTNIISR